MKKLYILIFLLASLLSACTDDFEDYNTDDKNPAEVSGNFLFSNAQKELIDQISSTNVNLNNWKLFAQYWTETTYTDESNYDVVTRNVAANVFSRFYLRVLKDLNEAATLIATEEVPEIEADQKQNRLFIIELVNVYTYQRLVDIFGMVPYTEALNIGNVYPKYDDGFAIYQDLISRLNTALSGLKASAGSFGSSDLFYGGDVASWIKFGNSLKLKIGITLADYDENLAKTLIEAAVDGAFSSADDDCRFGYLSSSPNFNPIYEDVVASGRDDFVPANTIVDAMNTLADPRREVYFTLFDGEYLGGPYGKSNPYAQYSHIGPMILTPDFEGLLLTYTEVLFYLAEAKERGFNVPLTAEEYYNMAIRSSFEFWGAADVENYLLKPDVAYATAAGDWKQKIGTQSWIASYSRGFLGYTTWRRLDYPVLNLAPTIESLDEIPVRLTFPINEQTLNEVNYQAAATAVGGDLLTTKIFWDKY